MDAQRFDDLAKSLIGGRSRRAALRTLLGGVAVGLLGARGARPAGATHLALGDRCTCPDLAVPCVGHCASRHCERGRCRCKPPTRVCDGQCVNTQTDPNHCGAACAVCTAAPANATPACVRGACSFACNRGFKRCGAGCIRAATCCTNGAPGCDDGNPCTSDTCSAGTCSHPALAAGAACPDGVCDGSGACVPCSPGAACPTGLPGVCADGTVDCASGQPRCVPDVAPGSRAEVCNGLDDDCDGVVDDGFDLQTDLNNCGQCGQVCPDADGIPTCVDGTCSVRPCDSGFGNCNGDPGDGCETDIRRSVAHCGRCHNPCLTAANETAQCINGACYVSCNPGFRDCNGDPADGCEINTQTNVNHCGGCNDRCSAPANATAYCFNGFCRYTCNYRYHPCGRDWCASDDSPLTCGSSCSPCPTRANATRTCVRGTLGKYQCGFTCNAGFGNCDGNDANGCETNIRANVNHCGRCHNSCGPDAYCQSGYCFRRA